MPYEAECEGAPSVLTCLLLYAQCWQGHLRLIVCERFLVLAAGHLLGSRESCDSVQQVRERDNAVLHRPLLGLGR